MGIKTSTLNDVFRFASLRHRRSRGASAVSATVSAQEEEVRHQSTFVTIFIALGEC